MPRHSDAIAISDGACNPSGIAYSIIGACKEMQHEHKGTQAICNDPAIKLMVYQLAAICGMEPLASIGVTEYNDWRRACSIECERC